MTERIDILVSMRGDRTVRRRLSDIGNQSEISANRVDRLRQALLLIGATAAVGGIIRVADAFTRLQNRLRVVTDTTSQLNQVQSELFAIANRTRTPVEELANLFQRGATAADELGASQEELLQFTEAVGAGLASQGGAAAESAGALRQLSQSLSSGIVRAEEFNSILEGAFPIAQAAARGIDEAGGSVGRLRQLIVEGEITSREFFDALLSQSEQLSETFERTEATIGQAFVVLQNNVLQFIGNADQATGVTSTFAQAIILLADNLDTIANIAGVAVAIFGAQFAAGAVSATIAGVNGLSVGLARLNTQFATINLIAGRATVSVTSFAFAARAAGAIASTAFAAIGGPIGAAILGVIGLTVAVNGLNNDIRSIASNFDDLNATVGNTDQVLEDVNAQIEEYSGVTGVATGQTDTLRQSIDELAESRRQDAIATLEQQRAQILAQREAFQAAVDQNTGGVRGFAVDIAATFTGSPGTAQFRELADQVRDFGSDEITEIEEAILRLNNASLEDLTSASERLGASLTGGTDAADSASEAIAQLTRQVAIASQGTDQARERYEALLDAGLDPVRDAATETAQTIIALIDELNQIETAQAATEAYSNTIQSLTDEVRLLSVAEGNERDILQTLIDLGIDPANAAYAEQVAQITALVTEKNRLTAEQQAEAQATQEAAAALERQNQAIESASGLVNATLADLARETQLLQTERDERQALTEVLRLEQQIRSQLVAAGADPNAVRITAEQRQQIEDGVRLNQTLARRADLLDSIVGPTDRLRQSQSDLANLFRQGDISLEEYEERVRSLNVQLTALDNTFGGGIANGIARITEQANNLGAQVSDVVVGSFNNLTDAVVNFARTGTFSIRSFFSDLANQLLRLATNQLLISLLSSFGGGGGFGGGLGGLSGGSPGGLLSGLLGFQTGGSFTVGGSGGADSQLVAFRATPGEQVNVATPQQVQRGAPGANVNVQPQNIRIVNVIDPAQAVAAMESSEGEEVILNTIQQNPSEIRRLIGA